MKAPLQRKTDDVAAHNCLREHSKIDEVKNLRDLTFVLAVIAVIFLALGATSTNRAPGSNAHWMGQLSDAKLAAFVFATASVGSNGPVALTFA